MNNRFSISVHNRWFGSHLEEMHCAFIIFVLCDELCGSCSWLLDMQAQLKANLRMWLCLFYQEVVNDYFTWQVAFFLSRSWNWSFHLAGCPSHHLHDHPGRQLVHHQRRLWQSSSDGLLFSKIFAQLFPGSLTLHNSFQVTNMDSCMTSIEDSECTSSYGATSNYVSNSGSSLVGWVQQLSMFQ